MGLLGPPAWEYREAGLLIRTVDPAASDLTMAALTDLMERAWRDDDQDLGERNLVPSHVFDGQAKQGNLLITIEEDTGEVVGFINFVTPAAGPGPDAWVYSHTVGIDPEWKDRGIGTVSKRAQAAYLDECGYRGMAWTFDPNQGRNARLNFHKLGCVNLEFRPNQYPELPGLPADRFVPFLDLHADRYRAALEQGRLPPIAYDDVAHVFVLDDNHRVIESASAISMADDGSFEVGSIPTDQPLLVDNPWDFDALADGSGPSDVQRAIHAARRALFSALLDSPRGRGSHAVVDYLLPEEVLDQTGHETDHPGYILVSRTGVELEYPERPISTPPSR